MKALNKLAARERSLVAKTRTLRKSALLLDKTPEIDSSRCSFFCFDFISYQRLLGQIMDDLGKEPDNDDYFVLIGTKEDPENEVRCGTLQNLLQNPFMADWLGGLRESFNAVLDSS